MSMYLKGYKITVMETHNNVQSVEDAVGKTEQPESLSTLVEELKKRCDAANIKVDEVDQEDGDKRLTIHFNAGRDKRQLVISRLTDLRALLAIPFETYTFISGYEAICSYTAGTIEAAIRPIQQFAPPDFVMRRLTGTRFSEKGAEVPDTALELKATDSPDSEMIEIGAMSKSLQALWGRRYLRDRRRPVLRISGLNISRHDQAVKYLERISHSLFFGIDLTLNLPLTLVRERPIVFSSRTRSEQSDPKHLRYPSTEYDQPPMSLYWYARSATGMPLLQFLAYYQSIEFYFPIYSQAEAQQKVKNILKDPSFNPHKDADIGRLLTTIKSGSGRGYGEERAQLRATLQHCVNPDGLRNFLTEDVNREDAFTSKSKALNVHKIPITNPDADLRNDVADRIYGIRCKIVHTKNAGDDGEVQLLLPFSKEAESLEFDIELMQYLSRQVLIAASDPLRPIDP